MADPSVYEAEQQALADGGASDVSIPVPTAPEVNPDVYRQVVSLVFKGFLTLTSVFNETAIVWKSLNQHEFDLIRLSTSHVSDTGESVLFWDTFIAYSIFMVNGMNLLPSRERTFGPVRNLVKRLPREAKQRLVRELSELNRRSAMATLLVEAYAMEPYSRFRWAQVKGLDLSHTSVTGIPGTERLGLNWSQLTWRALNGYEDTTAANERDWENAKFLAGATAGKAIQKIYSQDHDRHRKDAEDRIARKDRLLRHVFEGASLEDTTTLRGGQVVMGARTVEDLAKQMERDLRGEKDWHDEVIAAHEARIQQKLAEQRATLEELTKKQDAAFRGRGIQGSTSLEGLTAEEVRERMERGRQLHAQALAQSQVRPELDQRMVDHHQRWGRLPEQAEAAPPLPLVAPREAGKPFRRT